MRPELYVTTTYWMIARIVAEFSCPRGCAAKGMRSQCLTITLAAAIIRDLAFIELLVVSTSRSRWITYTRALELDAKLALAANLIRQLYKLENVLLQNVRQEHRMEKHGNLRSADTP
jgi:hypothetical protein